MITVNRVGIAPLIKMKVGTGGVKAGQLAMVSSDTAVIATEGQSTAVLLGIACEDYDADEVGCFYNIRGADLEFDVYQGGATDTFTDANIGADFDIYHAGTTNPYYIDPNDTTGGMFTLKSYDNDRATAVLRVISALCYV